MLRIKVYLMSMATIVTSPDHLLLTNGGLGGSNIRFTMIMIRQCLASRFRYLNMPHAPEMIN